MYIYPIKSGFTENFHNKNKKTSFKGLSPEILRNQMKIYLCQDIFAEKLKVKLPETALERDVLLEILQQRLQLDKLTRLANEKMKIKTKLEEAVDLVENNPDNPRLEELRTELSKKGNLSSTVETISKNIEKERKVKKPALDYFANIASLEEEYYDRHLITSAKMSRFLTSVKNQNINKNGEYSTQDLIDIIQKQGFQEKANTAKTASVQKPSMNKSRFIAILTKQYEDYIRSHLNIYRGVEISFKILTPLAHNHVHEKYGEYFKKFPEVEKQLNKICSFVQMKYKNNIARFKDINIYVLASGFSQMDEILPKIKRLNAEYNELKTKSLETPTEATKKTLLNKKAQLTAHKILWQDFLDTIIDAESDNRNSMKYAGFEKEYNYVTEKCNELNKLKELYQIYKQNNDTIPDEIWEAILK